MTVNISKPALNLREELAALRNQGGAYEESKFYLDSLVTNGTFDSDTDWTKGAGWTISSGGLVATNANSNTWQDITLVVGKMYTASFDVTAYANGGVVLQMDNVSFTSVAGAVGTYSGSFIYSGVSNSLKIANSTGSNLTVDNISVYEVAPSLVTTITNGSTYAYDTLTTAGTSVTSAITDGSNFAGIVSNGISFDSGVTYAVSLNLTLNSGSAPEMMIVQGGSGGGTVKSNTVELANGYNSFTLTTTSYGTFYLQIRNTNGELSNFSLSDLTFSKGSHSLIHSTPHGYSIKDVYIDGELAREGSAYDYTVHDGYIKPTIAPTATTETCLIGVRT